jgi:hypothetical protein
MELRLQELVRLALVDQDLGRPRASPDELGRIVGPPGIAIRPEIVREGFLAPRAAHGRADGRERRHGTESFRVPERGHERAVTPMECPNTPRRCPSTGKFAAINAGSSCVT